MAVISVGTTSTTGLQLTSDTTGTLVLKTANGATTVATLNASGNLGLGITPVGATYQSLEFGAPGIIRGDGDMNVASNAYFNAGWKYKSTAVATLFLQTAGQNQWYTAPSGTAGTAISWTQAMTLSAAGNLGLGTASAGARLDVRGTASYTAGFTSSTANTYGSTTSTSLGNATLQLFGAGASGATTGMRMSQGGSFELYFGGVQEAGGAASFVWQGYSGAAYAERMRLDASGNLGLGVTPSAWAASWKAIEGQGGFFGANSTDGILLSNNAYSNGTNWIYKNTKAASIYEQNGGVHYWFNAPSGTAGNAITFTERMRLDASGNLGLGVTPSVWLSALKVFQIGDSGSMGQNAGTMRYGNNFYIDTGGTEKYIRSSSNAHKYIQDANGGHTWHTAPSGTAGNAISFTQAMTLDANGQLGVGTSSPRNPGSGYQGITLNGSTSGFLDLNTNGTRIFTLYGIGNDVLFANPTSAGTLQFLTNNTERARIDSSGNFMVGSVAATGTATFQGRQTLAVGTQTTYAVAIGNASRDDFTIGSDTSAIYLQSWNSKPLIINSQGNEVRIAATTDQGGYNLQCNGTGVWGAGAYVNGSDARLKDDIQPLAPALDVVKALNPVTFRYKPEYSKDQNIQPGFIAQELQAALAGTNYVDGVVQSGPQHLNVAYQSLIPVLVKAIQELEAEVATLKGAA